MMRMSITLAFRNPARERVVLSLVVGLLTLVSVIGAWGGENPKQGPSRGSDLVNITEVNPRIIVDLKYATEKNFAGKRLYESNTCFLRRSTAVKLGAVQGELEGMGLGLKVWDCYRPLAIQRILWAGLPDERYVANPEKGSRHNRAASVDLTLVDSRGKELEMPTGFDDFSPRAHRHYQDLPDPVIRNRALLEGLMKKWGFIPLAAEWWHYDAEEWAEFDVLDLPFHSLPSVRPQP